MREGGLGARQNAFQILLDICMTSYDKIIAGLSAWKIFPNVEGACRSFSGQ